MSPASRDVNVQVDTIQGSVTVSTDPGPDPLLIPDWGEEVPELDDAEDGSEDSGEDVEV